MERGEAVGKAAGADAYFSVEIPADNGVWVNVGNDNGRVKVPACREIVPSCVKEYAAAWTMPERSRD